ncbi:MAG: hypothetical protein P1U78_04875 [Alcanivoracaceae bacterium]|nr:hypothetical protein [Alcanivoracaceae bacterium]
MSEEDSKFPLEPIRMIGLLVRLQDDLSYTGECVADNLTGEAKYTLFRTLDFVEKEAFPLYIKSPVHQGLSDIKVSLSGRDMLMCRRKIQDMRRHLANEIALRAGLDFPYSINLYPPFSSGGVGPS